MTDDRYFEPQSFVRTLAKGYMSVILLIVGFVPASVIAYLYLFQDSTLRFEHHGFHEFAIAVALLQSGFIAYVTYRCYLRTKEPFLCWLTLGFLAFTVIYAFHGVFTRISHEHLMLFVLYGPASRLVMAACFLAGLVAHGWKNERAPQARGRRFWMIWFGALMVVSVLVALLALSNWAEPSRWVMELLAMCIMVSCASIIVARRIRSPLMTIYALSLVYFAQSSFAFMLAPAWSHMWWLSHAIFAFGFMALSYGVIVGFLTTGSFSRVYSQAELIEQLRAEKARADNALLKFQDANEELKVVAATDPLTGCANRRGLEARGRAEVARSKRGGAPLSFVTVDIDYFKQINDRHGHAVGDEVLMAFVDLARKALRPSDLLGRLGGEEFALLLPDTPLEGAVVVAERLRELTESESFSVSGTHIRLTVSLGVAQYSADGDSYESLMEAADRRMYRAKEAGRNRVIAQ